MTQKEIILDWLNFNALVWVQWMLIKDPTNKVRSKCLYLPYNPKNSVHNSLKMLGDLQVNSFNSFALKSQLWIKVQKIKNQVKNKKNHKISQLKKSWKNSFHLKSIWMALKNRPHRRRYLLNKKNHTYNYKLKILTTILKNLIYQIRLNGVPCSDLLKKSLLTLINI